MKPASLRALAARLLVAASVTASCTLALADTTPLRILVGFPAGGSTDLIARQLAAGLQTELARPVVVENRAGAGGQIAAQALKAARPDGHTLFLSNGHTVSIVPVTMANPGFDVAKDFAPVGLVTSNPDVFAVNPAVVGAGVTDIRGFAAWARAHAGKNSVGVPAPGSGPEFAVGVLGRALATPMTAVPYRGDGPLVQDLVAGQVPAGIGGVGAILPYVESGKLRLLAVNGPARIARLPEVPTYAEAGIAGLEEMMFTAVFAPAGTPDALLRQYNAAIARVVNAPAFAQRIASLGVTAATSTPEALAQRVESGRTAYGQLVKTLDYKLQ